VLADRYNPLLVVGWARADQLGDLGGTTPADWISQGGPEEPVLLAAKPAARGQAQ
jgi:hypothetical protein